MTSVTPNLIFLKEKKIKALKDRKQILLPIDYMCIYIKIQKNQETNYQNKYGNAMELRNSSI